MPFCPKLGRVPATRSALPPWDHERPTRQQITSNAHQAPPRATKCHQAPPNASQGMSTPAFRRMRTKPHEKLARDLYLGLKAPPSATKRHQAQPSATKRNHAPREGETSTPGTNQRTSGAPTPTVPREGATPGHRLTNQRRTNADQASRGRSTPAFRQMRSKRNTRLKRDLYPGLRQSNCTPREGGLPRLFDTCAPNATQSSRGTSTPGNEPRALPRTRSTRLTSFAVLQSYCLAVLHASPGMALPAFTLVWGHFYLGLDTRHQKRTKRQIRAFAGDACPGLSTHAHQAPHVAHERSLPRAFTHTTPALQTQYTRLREGLLPQPLHTNLGPILPRALTKRHLAPHRLARDVSPSLQLPQPPNGWDAEYDTTTTNSNTRRGPVCDAYLELQSTLRIDHAPRNYSHELPKRRESTSIGDNTPRIWTFPENRSNALRVT